MKLKIDTPDKLFFTSDTHFGHKNIILLNNRPFTDIQEHDETLISNWNEVIPEDGIVIHQGDFFMGVRSNKIKWILESLNFGTIYLTKGNHEKDIMKKAWVREYFAQIADRIELEIDKITIVADHFPMLSWNKSYHGSYHTFGHVHGNLIHPSDKAYNVGVDTNDYRPISYYDLMKKFNKK